MGILTIALDSRGAAIPYLELMEQFYQDGVEGLTYVTADLQSYVDNLDAPTIVDRLNLSIFTSGNPVYDHADYPFALWFATRRFFSMWSKSAMVTIAAAAQEVRFIPAETVVICPTPGLLLLGHFLLELGVRSFICLDPFRAVDWKNLWERDRSQYAPGILPKPLAAQFIKTFMLPVGKQRASEFFGYPVHYDFSTIKGAVRKQLHMYSPQLATDKHLAQGYLYPSAPGQLSQPLANFIAKQRQHGKRIFTFTIGSMDISLPKRTHLIQQFMAGVRALGDTTGIIVDDGPMDSENFISTLGFVPYAALFPQVDLVVIHGGAGSMHLALYAGTPVLNIPFVKDQYDWADRLQYLGMQVDMIPQKQFTAERFVTAVKEKMTQYVVTAARLAGETERELYSNPRALMDEILEVAEAVSLVEKRV